MNTSALKNETVQFIIPALGFVVAFAWRDAITKTFEDVIKKKLKGTFLQTYPLVLYYLYAFILTILVVFITKFLNR